MVRHFFCFSAGSWLRFKGLVLRVNLRTVEGFGLNAYNLYIADFSSRAEKGCCDVPHQKGFMV